jgi:hypothetical protein
MSKNVELEGVKETLKALGATTVQIERALAAAIYQEALALDAASVAIVPVDQGPLRRSHYAAPPVETQRDIESEVGYGVSYALIRHENPAPAVFGSGQGGFLRKPLNKRKQGYNARVAKRTAENWRRGIGVDAIPATAPTKPKVDE